MAAVIGALRAVLSAQIAEFTEDMGKAADSVAGFQKKFAKVGKSLQKTGAVMSAAVTAPLAAFGATSVKAASQFEKSMSDVSTLVDTATESMQEMGRAVLDVASRTPVAIEDLTSALYDVRSAGVGAGDAMDVLEGSARLAVAGLGSTKEAVNLVTSAINAFNLEGEDQARVYDTIFKTIKTGKTTLSELSQGFGAVAGTVANAGVKLDEYLASVAALTTTGLPAAQAHTQLRAAIAGLTRETKLSSQVFGQLGVRDFPELIEKSGGMVAAFQRIVTALKGNDAEIIKLLGSVEAYNAVIGLTGGQNEAFASTLESMRSGVSAVDEAFAKQNATVASAQQRMDNAIASMSISVGQVLAPIFEKLAGFIANVANAFNALSPETQAWIVQIGALAAAIGPVLVVLGTLVTAIGAVLPALTVVGTAIAALGAGPLALIVGAITAVYLAWQNWGQIVGIVSAMVEGVTTWLRDKLGAILDWVAGKVNAVTGVFKDMYQRVVGGSYVPDMVDGIEREFGRLQSVMVTPAQDAASSVEGAFSAVVDTISGLFDKLFSDGKLTLDDLKKAALDLAKQLFIQPFFNALRSSFGGGGLFGSLFGGGFGGGFAGLFADGGTIPKGQWGIVGERGPEPVFAGSSDLTVYPNGSTAGGVTQVFNISTPNADSFRLAQRQIARMARQRLQV